MDEDNNPINQKTLADLMEVDRKTIQRNMKALEQKKCIVRICLDKNTYYLVNPYLMFCGKKVNKQIPKLFDLLEFKNSRINRRETVKNRHKVS